MRSLRLKALFSLLSFSTSTAAQSSSWGEPFSVDLSSSTQSLHPTATSELVPTSNLPSETLYSGSSGFTASAPTLSTSLATPASFTAFLSTTLSKLPTSSGLATSSSAAVSFSPSGPSIAIVSTSISFFSSVSEGTVKSGTQLTSSQGSATVAATSLGSTGAGAQSTPYTRMGLVGVLAGVAGVFVV